MDGVSAHPQVGEGHVAIVGIDGGGVLEAKVLVAMIARGLAMTARGLPSCRGLSRWNMLNDV